MELDRPTESLCKLTSGARSTCLCIYLVFVSLSMVLIDSNFFLTTIFITAATVSARITADIISTMCDERRNISHPSNHTAQRSNCLESPLQSRTH